MGVQQVAGGDEQPTRRRDTAGELFPRNPEDLNRDVLRRVQIARPAPGIGNDAGVLARVHRDEYCLRRWRHRIAAGGLGRFIGGRADTWLSDACFHTLYMQPDRPDLTKLVIIIGLTRSL